MKTTSVGKNVVVKKPGRPPKKRRGRPKRIMFPRLPKPAQVKWSFDCSVNGCQSTESWMFTLPEADDLRECWLEFLSRPNWIADHRTRVCEIHFERQMWKNTRYGQRTLRDDAIPTIYELGCGDEVNRSLNFVDMVNFEDSEVFIKPELLEPEIEVLPDPDSSQLNRSSICTKRKTEFVDMSQEPESSHLNLSSTPTKRSKKTPVPPKSRKQQYLINMKKNPAKYALFLERERLRHKIRRKSKQSLPCSVQDDWLTNEDVDMHELMVQLQAEEGVSQIPSMKVEPLFPTEEESIVPDFDVPYKMEEMDNLENKYMEDPLVAPSSNNLEGLENLKWENVEANSSDLSCHLKEEKGYRCPLCKKYLSRKGSMKYHLEKTHPFDLTAQRLAADLRTRFKFQKRENILKEWYELFPDLAEETSSVSSTLALTSNNSPVVTNVVPEMSTSTATSTEQPNKDYLLKHYLKRKVKLASKTNPTLPEETEPNPESFHIISSNQSQPQLETFSTLSVQQLLETNSEVDPVDAKKDKLKNAAKDASSYMFCASLRCVPVEKRKAVKQKLMELVNAVIIKNLDPERIIIAYTL